MIKITWDKKSKRRKKREFTKTMYIINVVFVFSVVIASYVLMFKSATVTYIDLSPIGYIVPAAFAELALHTGFVVWKAKWENLHKYPEGKDVKFNETEELKNDV